MTKDLILIILGKEATLLVHKAPLIAVSQWFAKQCKAAASVEDDLDPHVRKLYDPIKYLFVLEASCANDLPGLRQERLDYEIEKYLATYPDKTSISDEASSIVSPASAKVGKPIKKEDGGVPTQELPVAQGDRKPDQSMMNISDSYRALLQFLKSPPLCAFPIRFSDEVSIRSSLLATVVSLGERFEAMPIIRIHMNTLLYKLGGPKRLDAIKNDPPLWLCMATTLEDAELFKEAAIHIIGCQLQWLPTWTVPRSKISSKVLLILERKADRLMLEIFIVKQGLNKATVMRPSRKKQLGEKRIEFENVSPWHDVDAWLIVSLFRDFLATTCAVVDRGNGVYGMANMAHVFRHIERGDYLAPKTTMECARNNFPNGGEGVLDVVAELKKHATNMVSPLLRSTLQYKGADSLGYLTCVDIEAMDIPFVVRAAEEDGEF